MKSYECPWCGSGLKADPLRIARGVRDCPTCHIRLRRRLEHWWTWLGFLVFVTLILPFVFVVLMPVWALTILALDRFVTGLIVPGEILFVEFLIAMGVVYLITKPWFGDWCVVETDDSRAYWSQYCPVCLERPADDAIEFDMFRVCPGCKAEYVQRVKEGLGPWGET